MKKIKIVQFKPYLGNILKNAEKHFEIIDKAISEGIDIVVFPELSLTGYNLRDLVSDVSVNEESEIFQQFLEKSKKISIIFGFVYEDELNLLYNAAAYLENGKVLHLHKKVYLPNYTMFEESRYFASGNSFESFNTKHFKTGILICEDALHISSLYILSQQGVDTLFILSNSPARGVFDNKLYSRDFWETTIKYIANNLTMNVIFVNRTGVEDGVTFWGGSTIYTALGDKIAQLELIKEDEYIALLDKDIIRRARLNSPFYRDEDNSIISDYFNHRSK